MVARITPTESQSKVLLYNERKVTRHQAEFIHAKNFIQDKDQLTYDDKLRRFQELNELNTRSRVKMLHATLNYAPGEKLSNTRLAAISDRFMQGLNMEHQPYIVYRHDDAKHPHIHIVTSLIRPDGTRVNTHRMAKRLSEPTRKAIEKEFGLQPSSRKQRSPVLSPDEVQKITPGGELPVTKAMERILSTVNHHYNFTNLHQYNAILRAYNMTAETGSPRSKTARHRGIYYIALDDHGNKISPPVMASQLPNRPTRTRLDKKFQQSVSRQDDNIPSIRHRITWSLNEHPSSLHEWTSRLQGDGIDIITSARNGRNPHDYIYIDHRTKTAVNAETLGSAFTAAGIARAIGQQPPSVHYRRQQKPGDTRFNANVPQVMSSLLHIAPGSHDFRERTPQQRQHRIM